MSELRFTLDVRRSAQRRIEAVLEVERPVLLPGEQAPAAAAAAEFFLPTWTPGSYLIREYARHLGPVAAFDAETGRSVPCTKVRKNRFRALLGTELRRLRLTWSVYAHELTVRTADLSPEHAYWNHACVLLWPVDRRELRASITVQKPDAWDLACSLPAERTAPDRVVLEAADLDAAIDAPCLCGTLERLPFEVRGVPHAMVLDGLGPVRPHADLVADVGRIVAAAADVFGAGLPYEGYQFLCLFADKGHGGLEHAGSSTLLAPRTAMHPGRPYRDFLGLCAHELFHAWNIKRMRPQELWVYDYEQENHTPMLWLAEGFTAYYDDLLCLRAGVLSIDLYLEVIARNLEHLWSGAGRLRQSLSEASFDAWIRLYRPDENTRNSTQNYYGNGAMAAMVLDLAIRRSTDGRRSLDHALAQLYRETFLQGRGYVREDVERCLGAAAETDLAPLLRSLVDGPLDHDFEQVLAGFGVEVVRKDRDRPHLGLSFEGHRTIVSTVADGGPAHAAGIAPGDEVLAFDGLRATGSQWSDVLQAVAHPGRPLRVLVASRGVVTERTLVPVTPPVGSVSLRLAGEVGERVAALRRGWLGAPT